MKISKLGITLAIALGIISAPMALASPTYAVSASESVCKGIRQTSGSCGSESSVNKLVSSLVNILSWLLGIVAVVMIIIAGFKYVTSSGDTTKIASAKSTLLYALIGMVIAALSQALVRFVLHRTAG